MHNGATSRRPTRFWNTLSAPWRNEPETEPVFGHDIPLVMVVAVAGRIVYPANIDDNVALLELGWVTCAHELCISVCRQLPQQKDGKSFKERRKKRRERRRGEVGME